MQPLEHNIYRTLFLIRGEQAWDKRVAVIEIDEASLSAIGQFPWPRHYYIDLLKELKPASVVAFDILFADSTEEDRALARAMERHGDVIVATAWDEQRGVIGPNANVVEGAISTGHIHDHGDADGMTRTYQPKFNGTLALSVLSVKQYSQRHSYFLSMGDLDRSLWLNWPGLARNAPRYSFIDVLTGKISGTTFTDKIVFIGFTGVGLDAMPTPYNQNPPASGVYQHVVAANNLLTQNHLQPIVLPVLLLSVLLSPLVGYGVCGRRLKIQLLVSAVVILTWGNLVIVAFSYNYLLISVVPLLSIVLTNLFVILTERIRARLHLLQWEDSITPPVTLDLRSLFKPPASSQ
ncbi:MAG: CHASE2 domain-containing protein [Leptolyngbya sp. SIO3F4]|nr:CHASE2 domain-containing protein [Leptolyngbya sp. SIO3F4]